MWKLDKADMKAFRPLVFTIFLIYLMVVPVDGRRYRYCAEGCCIHEYCAYHSICYPKIHCELGCPDGTCINDICMPYVKCNSSTECKMAHVCTYHHNLGYDTCQYNLEIGTTLCIDKFGQPLLKQGN
ncbi:hypothetical protein SNE40_005646 [Patella caerulea]|uniref:Uncharacterized protein n=1 Tax=Patella caerulea TaxID=87958 RepID=A0AAN8K421_PATCE